MGTIHSFENEKLIICTMYSDPAFLEKAENMLISEFGPYDLVSADYPFSEDFSAYYDGELGGKAIRRIYSFEQCIDPSLWPQSKPSPIPLKTHSAKTVIAGSIWIPGC